MDFLRCIYYSYITGLATIPFFLITPRFSHRICSGFCPAGYMCSEGAVTPIECRENSYAPPGSSACIPCFADGVQHDKVNGIRCKTDRECCSDL
jgi:hypothetical protein